MPDARRRKAGKRPKSEADFKVPIDTSPTTSSIFHSLKGRIPRFPQEESSSCLIRALVLPVQAHPSSSLISGFAPHRYSTQGTTRHGGTGVIHSPLSGQSSSRRYASSDPLLPRFVGGSLRQELDPVLACATCRNRGPRHWPQ